MGKSPLSSDPKTRKKQTGALTQLEKAFARCHNEGIVILGSGSVLLAFDEDRLFASGWTERTDLIETTEELGVRQVDTDAAFISCSAEEWALKTR